MGKSRKNRTQHHNSGIIMLAYAHRYVYPILIPLVALSVPERSVLYFGIGLLLLAVYDFIGYQLRWKHIFCSYQSSCHKKMTPDHINWNSFKKADAYGIPIICGVLGLSMIFCHFFFL